MSQYFVFTYLNISSLRYKQQNWGSPTLKKSYKQYSMTCHHTKIHDPAVTAARCFLFYQNNVTQLADSTLIHR